MPYETLRHQNWFVKLLFRTTYVESKKVYWVKVISEVIKVKLASRTETYPSVIIVLKLGRKY